MKKYLLLAAVFMGQIFAMETPVVEEGKAEVAQPLSKQFIGTDGQPHTVQFANEAEIDALNDPNSPARITINGKNLHKPRVLTNQVRVAMIDNDPTNFMFAGRIVYGVEPGMDLRLAVILNFYKDFASFCGFSNVTYETHTRENSFSTTWVNPVHTATVVLGGATPIINTFSFYEVMAALIKESNADLAAHPVINSVDKPFFLMVYSETEPTGDRSNKVMTIKLPIDGELNEDGSVKENKGWKWAVFARIDGEDILELPTTLTNLVDAYKISRGIEF